MAVSKSSKRKGAISAAAEPKISKKAKLDNGKPKPKSEEQEQDVEDDFEGFESESDPSLTAEQRAELLADFDSESDDDIDDIHGIDLAKLPSPPVSDDTKKAITAAHTGKKDGNEPGVLYIGRLPHGFYEHQMRAYFSQFGTITRLRLARNRKTGAPKHYAFIEFQSGDIADIVAKTMDKYLLFGHILQVRRMPAEQVHEKTFEGANKRFKKIPWAAIERRGLAASRDRELWDRRVKREEARRKEKEELLKEYMYEFDMPNVKQVKDVPQRRKQIEAAAEEGAVAEQQETNAEADDADSPVKEVKTSPASQGKAGDEAQGEVEPEAVDTKFNAVGIEESGPRRSKRNRGSKHADGETERVKAKKAKTGKEKEEQKVANGVKGKKKKGIKS